jgi:uncharacterized membrane protein
MRTRARTYFIAGLLVFLPLAVTYTVLAWLFGVLDNFLGRVFTMLFGRPIPGLGLVATVVVIFLMGALVTNVLGRRLVVVLEAIVMRIPVARSIYSATKQISDSIFIKRKGAFQRAVLVEWPRKGLYSVGFVTGESIGEPQAKTPQRVYNVFIITTPNPTTGFLTMVPEDEIIPLEMSVEDALKLVISGGIVSPAGARVGAQWREEPQRQGVRPESSPREPGLGEPSEQEGTP